jgi:hypothetical protein
MKIRIKYLLLLLLFCTTINAQDRYKSKYPFKILLGSNVIDDSYTSQNQPFRFQDNWNVAYYPSHFGAELLLNNFFSIGTALTLNNYKTGKLVDGNIITKDQNYIAFDVYTKIDISDINWKLEILPHFSPYIIAGFGISEINEIQRTTFNYGVGTYFWFKLFTDECNCHKSILDNLGIFIQTQGKSSFKPEIFGNQIQHAIGIVYRFDNRK